MLLDEEENLSKRDYGKLKESIDAIAAATAGGVEKTALSNMFNVVVGSVVTSIVPTVGTGGNFAGWMWLKK